jgi:hypothetical protein
MRYTAFILCLVTAAACAMPALSVESSGSAVPAVGPTEPNGPGFDYDIQLNLIHTIPCTFAQEVLDMASYTCGGEREDFIVFIDAKSMKRWGIALSTDHCNGYLNLIKSPMDSPYGIASGGYNWRRPYGFFISDGKLYKPNYDDEWEVFSSPWIPGFGRCADWDPLEELFWTVNYHLGQNHLCSFLWGGDITPYQVLDANDDKYLGIGVFPFEGDLGFVFSEEDELELDFYRRNGQVLEKMGEAEVDFIPSIGRITSVDWHYTREVFFCAYEVAGDYYISEFSVDFGSGNDIEPPSEVVETSFGQIKAMYR